MSFISSAFKIWDKRLQTFFCLDFIQFFSIAEFSRLIVVTRLNSRMMRSHIKLFGRICTLADSLGAIVVYWDPKKKALVPKENIVKRRSELRKKCRIQWLMILVFIITGVIQCRFHNPYLIQANWMEIIVFCVTVESLIVANFYVITCQLHAATMCKFTNGLMAFNKMLNSAIKMKPGLTQIVNVAFAHGIYMTVILVPLLLVFGFHWQNPCKPSIFGNWLIPECIGLAGEYWSYVTVPIKMFILSSNYLWWSFGTFPTALLIGGIGIIFTGILNESLQS